MCTLFGSALLLSVGISVATVAIEEVVEISTVTPEVPMVAGPETTDDSPYGRIDELEFEQAMDDARNARFAPNVSSVFQEAPVLGPFTLGVKVGSGRRSLVFTIREQPRLVVKFEVSCDRSKLHPLLKDYWLSQLANSIEEGANPIFVSPAAALPSSMNDSRLRFTMTSDEWAACALNGEGVRFMIMERVGRCMDTSKVSAPGGKMGVEQATRVGIRVVLLVEKLHAVGLVHGAVSARHVCFRSAHDTRLTLIGFGSGRFIDPKTPTIPPVQADLPPWEFRDRPSTRRDLFSCLFLMAYLLTPNSVPRLAIYHGLTGPENLIQMQESSGEFDPAWTDPIAVGSAPATAELIKSTFARTLAQVRESDDLSVPYAGIVAELFALMRLARVSSPTDFLEDVVVAQGYTTMNLTALAQWRPSGCVIC